jgi:SOS response regulatory protein OraA/RecX
MRDYPLQKLKEKLMEKDYEIDESVAALEKVIELGLCDPEKYLVKKVKSLANKGHGVRNIIQKLKMEKIIATETQIKTILKSEEVDSFAQIEILIRKKLRSSAIEAEEQISFKDKQRLTSYLAQKGHSFDDIKSAFHQIFDS